MGRNKVIIEEVKAFLSRDIRRWPAIMFAVSRIARVSGRIMFLIDSIRTINIISAIGVPIGTRCAIVCLKFIAMENSK